MNTAGKDLITNGRAGGGNARAARQPRPEAAGRSRERWSVQTGLRVDAGVRAGRAELHMPVGLTFDSWRHIGRNLKMITDSSGWWLGDWLVYGENRFPNRYRVVIEETALDYQTLRNYAWVARKFPAWRRRDTLSLQHHAEIAALPEREQDRWLERAERGKWSTRRLRREIRQLREASKDGARQWDGRAPTKVVMSLDAGRKDRWDQAAEAAQMPLLDWIAKVLDEAATAD
ncbi:LmbU family transcriptional regulator [Actinomadura macra]|uniref:LmbU family transcriptional regulator n=1 Tax=Actinomadura macra TaxID=46164 RepID=UPI000A55C77A|nr:LmbU family transcriptional regulator [Actinomadura macra]